MFLTLSGSFYYFFINLYLLMHSEKCIYQCKDWTQFSDIVVVDSNSLSLRLKMLLFGKSNNFLIHQTKSVFFLKFTFSDC